MKRAQRQSKRNSDEVNQTFCLIATGGHLWMRGYFDDLPPAVRRRLREAPFNICPACLQTEVLPKVRSQHPEYSRERALMAAIEVMEKQVRSSGAPHAAARAPRR
jgi:hypothetical protein